MRLLFDHNIFSRQAYGGVTRYFGEIIPRLQEAADVKVSAPIYTSRFLQQARGLRGPGLRLPQIKGVGRLATAVNEALLPFALSQWKPDVLHETHYSGRRHDDRHGKIVFTVHDLTPEIFPEHFPHYGTILRNRAMAFKSDAYFVAISENTRRDLIEHFDVEPDRIRVIHHGAPKLPEVSTHRRDDQVLYVGARNGYKNFSGLLAAFHYSPKLARDVELVVFGGGQFTPSEHAAITAAGIKRVRHVSGDDAALARAYREATMLLYPSLYEGFGLPLLEAMTSSCPIACSAASCFPEIAGSAAAYFDPLSPAHIAEVIRSVLDDAGARQRLSRSGVERVGAFSWDQSARQHLILYQSIA